MSRARWTHHSVGFFFLRTPLLPHDTYLELSDGLGNEPVSDEARVAARLRGAVDSGVVREALYVASPSLAAAVDRWRAGQLTEQAAQKIIRAVYRYLARMSVRATPFGLCAGVSVGTIGPTTALELAPAEHYRRHTTLDCGYLYELCHWLDADPVYRAIATFTPNNALYRTPRSIRYAETQVDRDTLTMGHQLVAVERDPVVELVLDSARTGATVATLARRVADACDVTEDEARDFVEGLIDDQLLVSSLGVPVTGPDPLEAIVESLCDHPDPSITDTLADVRRRLQAFDEAPLGRSSVAYDAMRDTLARLPADVEPSAMLHVDLWKPLASGTLGTTVVEDVQATIATLLEVAPPRPRSVLDDVRDAFSAHFGEAWVPLTDASDPDLGLMVFDRRIAMEATPVLDGITFDEPLPADAVESDVLTRREQVLLDVVHEAARRGEREVVLDEPVLAQLRNDRSAPLPSAFAAWFQVASPPDEPDEVLFYAAVGPPATRLLGRFANGDAQCGQWVKDLAELEAEREPDAVLAEVVHLPEGRVGNVVCRPVLRSHEIPYMGRSGAPADRQLAMEDLWIRVRDGRFQLFSETLGKEVLPRLSCAHNTAMNTVPIYRFLAQLQHQDCTSWLCWSWGPLVHLEHLPRVRIGNVVVSRETWRLSGSRLQALQRPDPAARRRHVNELRKTLGLPRHVILSEGDNQLPLDLDNPVCVEVMARLTKNLDRARLFEAWPTPGSAGVVGPEGRYTNEIIVPFVTASAVRRSPIVELPQRRAEPPLWTPGATVLCSRLKMVSSVVDRFVGEHLSVVCDAVLAAGGCQDWWFTAGPHDDGWAVDVHFSGDPAGLAASLPTVAAQWGPACAEGWIRTWSVVTHRPALDQVGGATAHPAVQSLMAADSRAAVDLLAAVADQDETVRWIVAVQSVYAQLEDLVDHDDARITLLTRLRNERVQQLPVGARIERELSAACRAHGSLSSILERPPEQGVLAVTAQRLAERSTALVSARDTLRGTGALPCTWPALWRHLTVQTARRVLRPAVTAHELMVYDVLRRHYRSRAARARLAGQP